MFGSWIVVVKTVKNFYKLGYINQNICENWQLFFTFGNNIRSAKSSKFLDKTVEFEFISKILSLTD